MILFKHLCFLQTLHRINLPRINFLYQSYLHPIPTIKKRSKSSLPSSIVFLQPKQKQKKNNKAYLTKRSLPNDFDRPKVLQPQSRTSQPQKRRFRPPQLSQLTGFAFIRLSRVGRETCFQFGTSVSSVRGEGGSVLCCALKWERDEGRDRWSGGRESRVDRLDTVPARQDSR